LFVIAALGGTEFDEGPPERILNFLKKASFYISIGLSIVGFLLLVATVALGRGSALFFPPRIFPDSRRVGRVSGDEWGAIRRMRYLEVMNSSPVSCQ
jgi:hypothetical protein